MPAGYYRKPVAVLGDRDVGCMDQAFRVEAL